ncbi:hypothetical protein TNCV_2916091 [Trichonephila clavipes]|nr:hypothetical protein TNCV_2916091 [Trichonephila clavipes]
MDFCSGQSLKDKIEKEYFSTDMMEENYLRHRNGSEYYSKRKKPFVKDRSGQRYASDKEGNQLYPNSEKPFARNKNNEEYYARDFQENEMYPLQQGKPLHQCFSNCGAHPLGGAR